MKFLLVAVHAKYIHMGLAVYSLRSYAGKELREHIELAEYTINQQAEDILADLYRRRPDAVGFSCYIWNISMVKRLFISCGLRYRSGWADPRSPTNIRDYLRSFRK